MLEYFKRIIGKIKELPFFDLVVLFLLFFLFVLSLFGIRGCIESKKNLEILKTKYEQNIKSLKDSIKKIELKNGELLFEKMVLIADKKELEIFNTGLKRELEILKKNGIKNIKIITKDIIVFRDSLVIKSDSNLISFGRDTLKFD